MSRMLSISSIIPIANRTNRVFHPIDEKKTKKEQKQKKKKQKEKPVTACCVAVPRMLGKMPADAEESDTFKVNSRPSFSHRPSILFSLSLSLSFLFLFLFFLILPSTAAFIISAPSIPSASKNPRRGSIFFFLFLGSGLGSGLGFVGFHSLVGSFIHSNVRAHSFRRPPLPFHHHHQLLLLLLLLLLHHHLLLFRAFVSAGFCPFQQFQ